MSAFTTDEIKVKLDEWLVSHPLFGAGKGKWKRLSKKKNAAGNDVRVFENTALAIQISTEETGWGLDVTYDNVTTSLGGAAMTSAPQAAPALPVVEATYGDYIFAFGYGLQDGQVFLGIMKRETWDIEGHLDDNHQALYIDWLDEICESSFVSSYDKKTTLKKLTALGFKFNHGLSDCLNGWGDEDEKPKMDATDRQLAKSPKDAPGRT